MLNRIKRAIADYRLRIKRKRHHKHWAEIMRSGGTIHVDDEPDNQVYVDYVDGRMIGQRHVTPTYVRPFGMGRGDKH